MSLGFLLCLINRHRPVRDRVLRDDGDWVGWCRQCDSEIRRKRRGDWRREWKKQR